MSKTKHIEIICDSLAECYAQLDKTELITADDLRRKAKVTVEIYSDTPFNEVSIKTLRPNKNL